ncbi:hypothetical protein RJ639_007595 [Escallonia herrerae]|uniref:H/ACA ribonucleoprotein complex subunit n=1 Tax=Escallonia herrerae TaxID=1293975 RepID=A0AA88W078_9ASTE|nr:hypothetical protein RJ639_007595 [Escallonia herrerae]
MRPPRGRGGGGGFRGGRDGGRGRFGGGRDGGRGRFGGGGGRGFRDDLPPSEVVEVSAFVHACEGDAVTKLTNEKIPYFNAPIFLQNKTQIGKVDEIFGPINESYFSIKMMEGIIATSYTSGDKFYIDPTKLLPLARFLSQPKYIDQLVIDGDKHKLVVEVEVVEAEEAVEEAVEEVEAFVEGVAVQEGAEAHLVAVQEGAEGDIRALRNAIPKKCCGVRFEC